MARHKHADLIHAYAEGAEIQKFDHGKWWDDPFPGFFPDVEYRIKTPTVKREGFALLLKDDGGAYFVSTRLYQADVINEVYGNRIAVAKFEWEEEV